MPVCSGLYGPGGVGRTPNQKRDTPLLRLKSSTFHSFETPQEPKMLRALNAQPPYWVVRYNRSHLDDTSKNFSFLKSSSIPLFDLYLLNQILFLKSNFIY